MKHTTSQKWYKLSDLCVLSIFIMLFGEAFGKSVIGEAYRIITAGISLLLVGMCFLSNKRAFTALDRIAFRYTIIGLFLFVLSAPFWSTFYNSYSYIGIATAFFVYSINMERAYKLILFIAVLCVVLQTYEYATGSFLFDVVVDDEALDEKLFGGASGVFRARGLFYGPLNAGAFYVLISILFLKKNWVLLIGLVGCFLANSRTGIILLLMLFICKIFAGTVKKKTIFIFAVSIVLILPIILMNEQTMLSISRIGETGADNAQDARLFFWTNGILMYLNYPFISLLFGDNGLFKTQFDNNPESGWISLLVDNGIVGFLFYFVPICLCLFRFMVKGLHLYLYAIVILIVNNFVITAHLSGTSSLIFWLLIFEMTGKAFKGYSKIELIEKTC